MQIECFLFLFLRWLLKIFIQFFNFKMSKDYDRKYVISLGDKNISKLKGNIFNLIEYLAANPYPPKVFVND